MKPGKIKKRSLYQLALKEFFSSRLNILGFAIVLFMFLTAILAPFVANDKPYYYKDRSGEWYFPVLGDYGEYLSVFNDTAKEAQAKFKKIKFYESFFKFLETQNISKEDFFEIKADDFWKQHSKNLLEYFKKNNFITSLHLKEDGSDFQDFQFSAWSYQGGFWQTVQSKYYKLKTYVKYLNLFNRFRYPELKGVHFKQMRHDSSVSMMMPPIPYSPTEHNLDHTLEAPSFLHVMGTDEQGRDIAARMIHGAQISLSVGFIAVAIYVIIGIIVGSLAGYLGGWVDILISRFIEIVMCFPTFFLILTVLAFVGPSLFNIMVVIGLTGWTGIARLVRGEFLKLKNQEFVQSARVLGFSRWRIIFRHVLPNAMTPVLVSITFGIASSILVESSLSFLGFGVQPPTPSWGDILSQSREFMDFAWWLMLFPGVAIFLTVTAFNLVGEGLRDAIDPRN